MNRPLFLDIGPDLNLRIGESAVRVTPRQGLRLAESLLRVAARRLAEEEVAKVISPVCPVRIGDP
jgi:hypothetical protein